MAQPNRSIVASENAFVTCVHKMTGAVTQQNTQQKTHDDHFFHHDIIEPYCCCVVAERSPPSHLSVGDAFKPALQTAVPQLRRLLQLRGGWGGALRGEGARGWVGRIEG